jgi:periplasmic protein TonB
VTHRDRPKLPLLVLAAGGILLGAAALQSMLIRAPAPGSRNPHAITVDTKPPGPTPKPWDEPSRFPTVELPAEPADPSTRGAVPDAPKSADHAVDPGALAEPATSPKEPDKPMAAEPKSDTPPTQPKPASKPEPSQIVKSGPETAPVPVLPSPSMPDDKPVIAEPKLEPQVAEPKSMPQPEPAEVAKTPEETLEPVKAPSVPDAKPAEEAKVETLPDEPKSAPQPAPAQIATSEANDTKPEAVPTPLASKAEIKKAAVTVTSPQPDPQPAVKVMPREAKPAPREVKASAREEKLAPKATPARKPRETAAAGTQGGQSGKPMSLGFGRSKQPPAAGDVGSGRYAANVRAAIGRHRPKAGGGGSATVAFSIGPGGGLQGVRVVRSSGKPQADQAAIATVRAAAPFPPPPAGINTTFSIQIYFR